MIVIVLRLGFIGEYYATTMTHLRASNSLEYEPKPLMTKERRLSVWLLVVAAILFLLSAADFFGTSIHMWLTPATAVSAAHLEWECLFFDFQVWRSDPSGSAAHLTVCVISASVFFLIAWGVGRKARGVALLGMVLTFLVGILFLFSGGWEAVAWVLGVWSVLRGGNDGPSLDIVGNALMVILSVVLLLASSRLRRVYRET